MELIDRRGWDRDDLPFQGLGADPAHIEAGAIGDDRPVTDSVRYPASFDIVRLAPIGEPAYLDVDEAHCDYLDEQMISVVPDDLSDAGKPAWHLNVSAKRFRFVLTFYSDAGAPLRKVTWEREGDELVLRRTVDLFYPEGDPGRPVPWVEIPYVDREYSARGTVTVTHAPPGRVSGVTKAEQKRARSLPSFAGGAPEGRNGPVHTVGGLPAVKLPLPAFGHWGALLEASAPEDLLRLGPGAAEAAAAYAAADPSRHSV